MKWSMMLGGTGSKWHAVGDNGRAVCRTTVGLYNSGLCNIPESYKCRLCIARLKSQQVDIIPADIKPVVR